MPVEAKDIFEANSRNVRDMLSERGLGLYIPPYQRAYGWDRDKVNKLLEDAMHGFMTLLDSKDSFTFLGTVITIHDINFTTVQPIVRTEVPAKVLTVIDGQQRLTTLLLLCLALHNQIRLSAERPAKGKKAEEATEGAEWLKGQTLQVLSALESTFIERHPHGDSPIYPRMIRSFDDQWSKAKKDALYRSPVAYLISTYAAMMDQEKATEFKPKKRDEAMPGEEALVERYGQIVKMLKAIASGDAKGELEELPNIADIVSRPEFQNALLNHEFPSEVKEALRTGSAGEQFEAQLLLVLVANYVLNRIAVTVVRGKNEDYAFTVFESLNTTGEPLTAFETFLPKVVSAEGLDKYEKSAARESISNVSNYLSDFKVGEKLQEATRELLIVFASAETGTKLSSRLADQRRYLKEEFERYENVAQERLDFVRNMHDVTTFMQSAWTPKSPATPSLDGLPVHATTDAVKLCLEVLRSLGHSVTIAPLVRFFSAALRAEDADRDAKCKEFESAIKAMTAFSVLWRASRRTTGNIDGQYRELLSGANAITNLAPIARKKRKGASADLPEPSLSVDGLKAELRARLKAGGVGDRPAFIREAMRLPLYLISRPISRVVLLAAYHDAVEDEGVPGLMVKGKPGVSPCLTYEGYTAGQHLSLEHVAPQSTSTGWDPELWKDKEVIHSIGNLVLVQQSANASLGNRSWEEKRAMYAALSSRTQQAAKDCLIASGLEFGDATTGLIESARYMPHLAAIGRLDQEWSKEFVSIRAEQLLGMAWDELCAWLE